MYLKDHHENRIHSHDDKPISRPMTTPFQPIAWAICTTRIRISTNKTSSNCATTYWSSLKWKKHQITREYMKHKVIAIPISTCVDNFLRFQKQLFICQWEAWNNSKQNKTWNTVCAISLYIDLSYIYRERVVQFVHYKSTKY